MAEIPLDDDTDSTAMMEAMGFSGFGMQRSAKKRKFNPHADAAVAALPKRPTAAASTGANTAPLGERRLPPPSASLPSRPPVTVGGAAGRDADEIDLGDDGDGGEAGVEDVGGQDEADEGDDPGPQYIDTSRPSRDYLPEELEDMEMQGKIDAITATHLPGFSTQAPSQARQQQAPRHLQKQQSGRDQKGYDQQAAPGAGAPWWEGYHDAKMNENPWERLERQKGLEARGTWLSRDGVADAGTAYLQAASAVQETEDGKPVDDEKVVVPEGAALQAGKES